MPLPETLHKLVTAAGPSGYEQAPAAVFREAALGVRRGLLRLGRLDGRARARYRRRQVGRRRRAHRRDRPDRPPHRRRRVPVVHRRRRLGPDHPRRPARRDLDRSGRVPAWSASKPIHLMKDEDRKKVPQLKDLHIDIGAREATQARELVRIGDVGVIAADPVELPGRALRLALVRQPARLLRRAGGGAAGGRGRRGARRRLRGRRRPGGDHVRRRAHDGVPLRPDVAIVVDVTFATDQPGVDEKELGRHRFGSGGVINRGSTIDPQVFELLLAAGEAEGIPFTVSASARATGTDADAFHISRGGIPTGVVSLAAALHALPRRDGPARRRRQRRAPDRRLRSAARPGHRLQRC